MTDDEIEAIATRIELKRQGHHQDFAGGAFAGLLLAAIVGFGSWYIIHNWI